MYVALMEVVPLEPGALGEGAVGGIVACYTPASNMKEALEVIEASLTEAGVRLVDVEWCVNDDEVEWENLDSEEARRCKAEAEAKGGPVLSEFHTWGPDEEE